MVDFRRMIPVLAVLAFLLGSAVTASAQPLTCVTNGATNTPVRAEGLTELVGDFQITCTGGTPTALGTAIPTVNIQVFLNTQITSRCMGSTSSSTCIGNYSEALLILDEPIPTAQYGCPTQTCTNLGTGTGTGAYGGGTSGTQGNAKNIFQGIQTASNSITFLGIPIDPPGTTGQRIIRITNIRGNANGLGVASGNNAPTSITEQITATPFNFLPVSGLATQAVGSVQLGMSFAIRSASGGSYTTKVFQQCFSESPDGTPSSSSQFAILRYTELFATAFKKRSINSNTTTPSVRSDQNNLAPASNVLTFNTETGFSSIGLTIPANSVSSTSGTVYAGDADWGTRVKAVFNNVPAGVRLYVGSTSSSSSSFPDVAQRTSAENGVFSALTGTQELTITNGTASAVWEVLESDANSFAVLNFPVYIRYTANPANNSPALGTATVNGSYAPTSTVTSAVAQNVPRFADNSTARNLFSIVPCVTNLLYPFVTSQLGFDTGIAISNTSTDPFGTSAQSGTCTLNWYGSAFTGATATPVVTSGTTYTTLTSNVLSNVAGGFTGYMIAQCRFQYAHGFAFVSDIGARNLAMGYLALIIPDPARNPDPFPVAGASSGEQLGQ